MSPRCLAPSILALTALAVLAGCSGGNSSLTSKAASTGTGSPVSTSSADFGLQSQFESTVRAVLPSVVLIQTDTDLGSGVIFDGKGDIVTNAHVVGNARTFVVEVTGIARPLSAHLVGTYPPDDLAVIRVDNPSGLEPARFADSGKVKVGEIVLAMGNPLGLASSVTNGIVSAVGRTVTEPVGDGSPGATLPDTIQTSAAINPGNSGGALVDLDGQVIGTPTLAATDQQEGGAAPGIGFAISSNIVKDVALQLAAHGRVSRSHRAALDIAVTTVTGNNGRPTGAGIVKVEAGGAAAAAGLRPGDVITSVAGTPTQSAEALTQTLADLRPGQQVKVTIDRPSAGPLNVDVKLGSLRG